MLSFLSDSMRMRLTYIKPELFDLDILCGVAALGFLLCCIKISAKCRQENYSQIDEFSAVYVGTEMIKSERNNFGTAFS